MEMQVIMCILLSTIDAMSFIGNPAVDKYT